MTGEDDDIALSLPEPPPPAPGRRETAIGEAMRRFDGAGDAPARPARSGSGSWWGKPQLGLAVTASMMAVIGLPLAWLTLSQKHAEVPVAQDVAGESKSFEIAEAPPPADAADHRAAKPAGVLFEPPAMVAPPPMESAAIGTVEPAPAPAQDAPVAKRAQAADDYRNSAVIHAEAPAAAPVLMAPPAPPVAMAAPAAPAKAARDDAARESLGDVIVTAQRRKGRAPDRGDWNACTINDPKQNLAACKSIVNPGAKGTKGQAAAHIADGLSQAWEGNEKRAIAAFDQAIAIAPKSSLAYLNRGLTYARQGNADRALADLDQAVRLAPGMARAYYNRSLILRERGDIKRAKTDEDRAMDLDPGYEDVVER